jgi:large subunit ribosomal protein L25
VTAGDLKLPTGSTLAGDPAQVLLIVQEAPTEAQIDAELAEAAEELGIVEEAPQAEAEAEGEAAEGAPAEGAAEGGEAPAEPPAE